MILIMKMQRSISELPIDSLMKVERKEKYWYRVFKEKVEQLPSSSLT